MSRIFLFTLSRTLPRDHLKDSIENPIPFDKIRPFLDTVDKQRISQVNEQNAGLYAWGAVEGTRNKPNWDLMQAGDHVLTFWKSTYIYYSTVITKLHNPEVAKTVWDLDETGKPYEYMYFVTHPERINVDVSEFGDYLHNAPQGFWRVSDEKLGRIASEFGSVKAFIEKNFLGTVKEHQRRRKYANSSNELKRASQISEIAKNWINDRIFQPALTHRNISKKTKDSAIKARGFISKFRKVGDIHHYLLRFSTPENNEPYRELTNANLNTFESMLPEFEREFSDELADQTNLTTFIEGQEYYSQELLVVAELFDYRSGGITPIGTPPNHEAVICKVNIPGKKYPNKWIRKPQILKYYLKSVRSKFDPAFKDNASIINFPHVPVYLFIRENHEENRYRFFGRYHSEKVDGNIDGEKWFVFQKNLGDSPTRIVDRKNLDRENERRAQNSKKSSHNSRKKRLKNAQKKPKKMLVQNYDYERNWDVVVEVLERANGVCESCGNQAPFIRKKDNTPYLEVHHKIWLSKNGEDTVENAVAICPNCHRQAHYGTQDPLA